MPKKPESYAGALSDEIKSALARLSVAPKEGGTLVSEMINLLRRTPVTPPVYQTVTTVEDLDALPVGAIVREVPRDPARAAATGAWGAVAQKRQTSARMTSWCFVETYHYDSYRRSDLLPGIVIFNPADFAENPEDSRD